MNNTVLDPNTAKPGPAWIRIGKHKDGTAPTGCVVRNNIAHAFTSDPAVAQDHNVKISDPTKLFVDPAAYDLHLLPGCAAVDTGSAKGAPTTDVDGISRPQGKAVDVGAYEWHPPFKDAGLGDVAGSADGAGRDEAGVGDGVSRDVLGTSWRDAGDEIDAAVPRGDGVSAGDRGGSPTASDGCRLSVAGDLPDVGLLVLLGFAGALRRRRHRRSA